MKQKKAYIFSTTHIILLSFLVVILLGSFLLYLPISQKNGVNVSYLDALFTAASSTCVTGLVTVSTIDSWSVFGQIVILLLIQIGGLGVITIISLFMIIINQKFKLKDRQLIQDSFNLGNVSELKKFVKKVVFTSLIIEGIGSLLYMIVFIPKFGLKGIWVSIFNSISAFCNAGIDIVGNNSLCDFSTNPLINFVTCSLIIIGGIGFIVWWDLVRVIKEFKSKKMKCFNNLTLHSKIVLVTTFLLIVIGAILILAFEYNNPETLAQYNFFDKVQMSLFQSITTRTAGFCTIPQENLTEASAFVCMILMFIGGSPVGTAGGIKTVTFVVLLIIVISSIRNKKDATIFNRTLPTDIYKKALAVALTSLSVIILSTMFLLVNLKDKNFIDILYETISATGTVGLSRSLTMDLDIASKIVIILAMYFGRVGPISLAIAFNFEKKVDNIIKNPVEDIRIG